MGFKSTTSCLPCTRSQPVNYLAERSDVLNGLQGQVTTKLKSSLGYCSGRIRIILAQLTFDISSTSTLAQS